MVTRKQPLSQREKLLRLRAAVRRARQELANAEAELAQQRADAAAFERKLLRRVGRLLGQLTTLEKEVKGYKIQVLQWQSRDTLGENYIPVEEQYYRVWEAPREAAQKQETDRPLVLPSEKDVKRLYRQLARRFHPDLADDDSERHRRHEQMSALNEAYSSGNVRGMMALADGRAESPPTSPPPLNELDSVIALEEELQRIGARRREIRAELDTLMAQPTVQLAVDVKLAAREGHDLLAEMRWDLGRRVDRLRAERDLMLAQLRELGLEP